MDLILLGEKFHEREKYNVTAKYTAMVELEVSNK